MLKQNRGWEPEVDGGNENVFWAQRLAKSLRQERAWFLLKTEKLEQKELVGGRAIEMRTEI